MIFLCGIPSEPSLGLVIKQLARMNAPYVVFNQHRFMSMALEFSIDCRNIRGWMQLEGKQYRLEDFTSVFTRLQDDEHLPEIEKLPIDSPVRQYSRGLNAAIAQWYEITPGRVLNRAVDVGSNYSKPYQSQIIHPNGFSIPETLITNEPELVHEFARKHGRIIYKSISYIRSIVHTVEPKDIQRLRNIRCCPTQFQEYIEGNNVRVHTIGDRVFATIIYAGTTDYRYAYLEGEVEMLEAFDLSDDLAIRCVNLAKSLRLEFAGIDLKITPDGKVYCLEVNPCPAYSYFEMHTDQPISQAVALYLAGNN
jgi:glutathione synthase/RimK-type ligase-like ATP-grasp enzyme